MIYTVWTNREGTELTLYKGDKPLDNDTPGLCPIRTIEAESWEDAMEQYVQYLESLEPHKPVAEK